MFSGASHRIGKITKWVMHTGLAKSVSGAETFLLSTSAVCIALSLFIFIHFQPPKEFNPTPEEKAKILAALYQAEANRYKFIKK
jgi:hypothetical protein